MARIGPGIALILCAAAAAAEPPAPTPALAAKATAAPSQPSLPRKPLDLRIGDVRSYMLPQDYRAALAAPDADINTIVVQGTRLLPMKSLQPVPAGFPPATLWWALRNPARSWRIFLPDLNAPASGPPVDKVPPPIFRWGP